MWHALEANWNVVDVLFHWRVNLCIVLAIAIAWVVTVVYPPLPLTPLIGVAILIGCAGGLVWELARS